MLLLAAVFAQALAGVSTADTVPAHTERLELTGAVGVAGPARLGVPVAPYLAGSLFLVHGLHERVDVGVRYTTALFVTHALSFALRVRLARAGAWAFGLTARADARAYAVPIAPPALGGDVLAAGALRVTLHTARASVSADAGASLALLAFDASGRRPLIDRRPAIGSVDFGLAVEWANRARGTWLVRFELAWVPLAGDPFALFGLHPRVAFGGSWGL